MQYNYLMSDFYLPTIYPFTNYFSVLTISIFSLCELIALVLEKSETYTFKCVHVQKSTEIKQLVFKPMVKAI